jgi:hypothetical protein
MVRLLWIVCVALVLAGCGGSEPGAGLRLADFPSGWREYSDGGDDSTCASVVAARKSAAEYGRSPQFEHPDGLVATSSVFHYADEAAARDAFAKLTGQTTAACLAKSLGTARAARIDVPPAGDEYAGLRATAPATKDHPAGVFDLVFVRSGAGVAELVLVGLSEPFDQRLRGALMRTVAQRLKAPSP